MAQSDAAYSGRPAFHLRMDVIETAVAPSTNSSTVSYHLYAICLDASYDSHDAAAGAWNAHHHGQNWSGSAALNFSNSYYGEYRTLLYGTKTVQHTADGTLQSGFYASHTGVGLFGSAYCPVVLLTHTSINRVPGAPTIGTITGITSTGASVPWSGAVANGGNAIVTYNVQVGTTSGGSNIFNGTRSTSPKVLTGLTRKTKYYVRVRAVSATGVTSAWSPVKSFTTLAEVPVMGTAYTAGSITRNSAIISGLSVTDNGGEAPSNVRAQYNTSASATGASVVTQGSWNNITIAGLASLVPYYYRCAAYNSAGWGEYPATWKSFTTLDDAPDDIATPTFSSVTDNSFRANWVAPAMNGATFVAYYYALSLVDTFASTVATGTTAALFKDFTGLIPGTHYYFRVRANATPFNGGYGVANQLTTGFAPNSGCRVYAIIGGVVKQGTLYTFVGGARKVVAPMYAHDGVIETE